MRFSCWGGYFIYRSQGGDHRVQFSMIWVLLCRYDICKKLVILRTHAGCQVLPRTFNGTASSKVPHQSSDICRTASGSLFTFICKGLCVMNILDHGTCNKAGINTMTESHPPTKRTPFHLRSPEFREIFSIVLSVWCLVGGAGRRR